MRLTEAQVRRQVRQILRESEDEAIANTEKRIARTIEKWMNKSLEHALREDPQFARLVKEYLEACDFMDTYFPWFSNMPGPTGPVPPDEDGRPQDPFTYSDHIFDLKWAVVYYITQKLEKSEGGSGGSSLVKIAKTVMAMGNKLGQERVTLTAEGAALLITEAIFNIWRRTYHPGFPVVDLDEVVKDLIRASEVSGNWYAVTPKQVTGPTEEDG